MTKQEQERNVKKKQKQNSKRRRKTRTVYHGNNHSLKKEGKGAGLDNHNQPQVKITRYSKTTLTTRTHKQHQKLPK